jgi:hypothetical protein
VSASSTCEACGCNSCCSGAGVGARGGFEDACFAEQRHEHRRLARTC